MAWDEATSREAVEETEDMMILNTREGSHSISIVKLYK